MFPQDTHQYFTKKSPAEPGDYIEFIADMDLLVAVSACPHGNLLHIFKFFANEKNTIELLNL